MTLKKGFCQVQLTPADSE